MSILIQCQKCGERRRVNERLAGRKMRCPGCEAVLRIPVPPPKPKPAEEAAPESVQEVVWDDENQSDSPVDTGTAAKSAVPTGVPTMSVPDADAGSSAGPDRIDPSDDEDDEWVPPRREREEAELDMTPMVDVTFLLLIFFMVTASFSLQKSIQMPRQQSDLPSVTVDPDPTDQLDPVELEIDENGGFFVLAADWEEETPGKQNLILALKRAIAGNSDGMRLSVKVQGTAKLQYLVDGMDAGTIAGFTEIEVTEVDGFN